MEADNEWIEDIVEIGAMQINLNVEEEIIPRFVVLVYTILYEVIISRFTILVCSTLYWAILFHTDPH